MSTSTINQTGIFQYSHSDLRTLLLLLMLISSPIQYIFWERWYNLTVILKFIKVVTYAHSYNYVANNITIKLNWNYLIPKLDGTPDTNSQKCRAAAAAVVALDDNWRLKQPATKASTAAWRHAMTKADDRKQCNNQPMTGESKAGIGGGSDGNSNGSSTGGGGQ